MMSDNTCANCHQSFATNEQIVNAAGHLWHTHCFVYVLIKSNIQSVVSPLSKEE